MDRKPPLVRAGCVYHRPPESRADKLDTRDIPADVLADMIRNNKFSGLPIRYEHHKKVDVGKVQKAVQTSDGSVIVQFAINRDDEVGEMVAEAVEKEQLKGLSIGHLLTTKEDGSETYELTEISICGEGARSNTVILPGTNNLAEVSASKSTRVCGIPWQSSLEVMCSKVEQTAKGSKSNNPSTTEGEDTTRFICRIVMITLL